MRKVDLKSLSPTAKILYWFIMYKRATGKVEDNVQTIGRESGIPTSSLYKAIRELEQPLTRSGSTMEY